ncbi:beta-lactamase family protein [Flavobacterium sp. AC]|uniref:Beta-lactamase family protein n=1 Tax=Flavobacterium azizsancarii TaxID=2961580 RepID=A0ABT4WEW1_9FLAO|nr:serine hydrolase domain-containing protein [Flavobacterium azizsancarii]MDA6071099.1 beta-lactamase family protein [Flavobacterium azizsancarii]
MKQQKLRNYLGTLFLFISSISYTQNIELQFRNILDSTYHANRDAVGIMIHVEVPDHKISWTYATGFSDRDSREKINKDQPLLIASNTKTYVAASILKLVENKKLQLNQPINNLLSKKTKKVLLKSGYNLNQITVRNLLSHTSGITDYVTDSYFAYVGENPNHQWTRDEQIELAMQIAKPLEPGKAFAYGDINYLLLSEIIEKETGKLFFTAIRDLLDFKKLKINETWFVDLEKKPANTLALAHQYSKAYGWDSEKINPSWDLYGGGGLASTTKDLAMFFQYLFEGKIIKDKKVLSELYTYTNPRELNNNYCLGLYNFPSFYGYKGYYHGGWWGTDVMYMPDLNTTISVFILLKEKRGINPEISHEIIEIVRQLDHS